MQRQEIWWASHELWRTDGWPAMSLADGRMASDELWWTDGWPATLQISAIRPPPARPRDPTFSDPENRA
jgi:hypothetical protein